MPPAPLNITVRQGSSCDGYKSRHEDYSHDDAACVSVRISDSFKSCPGLDAPGMEPTYQRLVEKLRDLDAHTPPGEQIWIGIAGGPGSGKSTVADALIDRVNQEFGIDSAVSISMDGWHIPIDRLLREYGEDRGMRRRGAPWTFDAKQCLEDLLRAKATKSASLPLFDRHISEDPVPNGILLKKTHRFVVVEGLYLLWKDAENEWSRVFDLFHERWFVKCPCREQQIARLVKRNKATWTPENDAMWGSWPEGSWKRIEYNDAKNMDLLQSCEKFADETILSV